MKAGRVIDGDEHDARTLAQQIVADARRRGRQAQDRRQGARVEHPRDARNEAERITAQAEADAAKLRDDARALANELVRGARSPDGDEDPGDVQVTGRMSRFEASRTRPSRAGSTRSSAWWFARPCPGVSLGELVKIDRKAGNQPRPITAEVVGFRGEQALLLPLGELAGVAPASAVWRTGEPLAIRCGDDLLGRALDGLGQPIDGGVALTGERWCGRSQCATCARAPADHGAARDRRARDRRDARRSAAASGSACSRRPASARPRCSARSRAARTPT